MAGVGAVVTNESSGSPVQSTNCLVDVISIGLLVCRACNSEPLNGNVKVMTRGETFL